MNTRQYYFDTYLAYAKECYEGTHISLKNKSQTYTSLKVQPLPCDTTFRLYAEGPNAFFVHLKQLGCVVNKFLAKERYI